MLTVPVGNFFSCLTGLVCKVQIATVMHSGYMRVALLVIGFISLSSSLVTSLLFLVLNSGGLIAQPNVREIELNCKGEKALFVSGAPDAGPPRDRARSENTPVAFSHAAPSQLIPAHATYRIP